MSYFETREKKKGEIKGEKRGKNWHLSFFVKSTLQRKYKSLHFHESHSFINIS